MANGKKSFVLYCDMKHTVDLLDDASAGKLFKHLLQYVNDENPETDDVLLKVAFEPIKRQLKRDLKDWEDKRNKRIKSGHEGGIKSGESRRKKQTKQMLQKQSETKQVEANEAVNVNGTVTVNVIERENTAPAHNIKNSNLFKKPNIPTKQQVLEAIVNAGGDKEMAKSFYQKHESTGWFINGSPIVNYITLAQRFVSNWKSNEGDKKKKYEPESNSAPLTKLSYGI